MRALKQWWRKVRKLDCPECKTALDKYGYCDPCNNFPHRRWITGADDLFISDVAWQREDPEDYAAYERAHRKVTCRYFLRARDDRDRLVRIYGEDLVAEVESELESGTDDSDPEPVGIDK